LNFSLTRRPISTTIFPYTTLFRSKIEQTQKEILQKEIEQIVNHILLKDYFESTAEVTTEQEIFLSNGEVIRPDRLNFLPNHQVRSEEHTSELQSRENLVCRLLLEK